MAPTALPEHRRSQAREPGSCLTDTTDLSHASASQLAVGPISPCVAPEAAICRRADWRPRAACEEPRMPTHEAGCGGIALDVD
ncbi:MAG: hypothetical protein ABSG43_18075 [Solirubrobacteraceae bacterium]